MPPLKCLTSLSLSLPSHIIPQVTSDSDDVMVTRCLTNSLLSGDEYLICTLVFSHPSLLKATHLGKAEQMRLRWGAGREICTRFCRTITRQMSK